MVSTERSFLGSCIGHDGYIGAVMSHVRDALAAALDAVGDLPQDRLLEERYQRLMNIGAFDA